MFEQQLEQARDFVRRIHVCKEAANKVPDSVKVSLTELTAWFSGTEQLVLFAFGGTSSELARYRAVYASRDELRQKAVDSKDPQWDFTYWIDLFHLMIGLLQEFEAKSGAANVAAGASTRQPRRRRSTSSTKTSADVVILTVLQEEYQAVLHHLEDPVAAPPRHKYPNLYAWKIGAVASKNGRYSVAVGLMGRAGTVKSAMATLDGIQRWHPRYLFFVGIAGGLKDLSKGDVVIADIIRGYEYGKIDKEFVPRGRGGETDTGLLTAAIGYSTTSEWKKLIGAKPEGAGDPRAVTGEIASGEKVVDDPTNEFFEAVTKSWPKIKAVEMEGLGAGEAIAHAKELGTPVSFMMIRGISDLPRSADEAVTDQTRGTQERDAWKDYASRTAAAFAVGLVAAALPLPPANR